jgi:dihydrofolate synthase / folylpolyglutamate synthase
VNKHQTLNEWLAYLERLHPKTIELGLERVEEVRHRMGLALAFPVITVGGTNGKGSVCALLESMLHAAGYRVGCYTSPHLLEYNERVRVGKQMASDAELCAAFEKVEKARGEISLTYFEFSTLAAMQCFIERNVEVAVLEVGLGGRLDAVNIFDADCSAVVSVDLDHTEYLGNTREQIAFEKAGIFRKGRVALFGDLDMPPIIASEEHRIGAELWRLGAQFDFVAGVQHWQYHSVVRELNDLPYPVLHASYQLNNASTALAALDALRDRLHVSLDAVRRGLAEVRLPGRFQIVPDRPQLILDVAHNPHAAHALALNLAALPPARTFAVFAMLKDKDMAGVVRALKEKIDVWLVAGIDAPRGATAEQLAQVLRDERVRGEVSTFASPVQAWRQACNEAREDDRIAVFGSFYTVADVMRARSLRGV